MKIRILILTILSNTLMSVYAHSITGTVTRVIDGDTCVVQTYDASAERGVMTDEFKVRLADIDAPESSQLFGKEATDYLSSLILHKTVIVKHTRKDRYRRIIGTIVRLRRAENQSVNAELISAGFAWHYRKYSKNADMADMEADAREEGRGLWGEESRPVAPWSYRKRGKP